MKRSYDRSVDILVIIFILLSLLISSFALASTEEAESKVKRVFEQIESSLSSLKSKNEFTKTNISTELTKYFLPEVNSQYFSYKVLNKNLPKLSKELKVEFVKALTSQFINTYSHLLTKYNDESISVGRVILSKSGKIAMVNLTIVGKKKSNKAVVKLLKSSDESWKFFDIVVEGISLIDTKQAEINSSINKLGVEATLQHLKEINSRNIPPPKQN
jgi:phospholipid transport system substrate-binding protein